MKVTAMQTTTCRQHVYSGHFHYFTGPKSYYPDKVMNSSLPPKPSISLIEDGQPRSQGLSSLPPLVVGTDGSND